MQDELLQLDCRRLVAQGPTKEEGNNYDEVFAPVARIEAIKLFLAYASFMGFIVYQMDVKSAFLNGTIEEEFDPQEVPDGVYVGCSLSSLGLQVMQRDEESSSAKTRYVADHIEINDWSFNTTLTASRPDIMFVVLLVQGFSSYTQDFTPSCSVGVFRYLNGSLNGAFGYPRINHLLEDFSDSDYAGIALTGNPQQEVVNSLQRLVRDNKEIWRDRFVTEKALLNGMGGRRLKFSEVLVLVTGKCNTASLIFKDAHTRFETASKKSHDPPLSEGNTSRSGEDNMEHLVDLTDFVPPTPYDSPLSGGHTPGSDEDLVIQKLKKRVKRLEKALRARTLGMKLFKIGTSRRKGLDKENVSKQGRKSNKIKPMFNDCDFDVLDDAMENVEGGSTTKQITTTRDILNIASINVSVVGPSQVSTVGPSNVSVVGLSTRTAGDIFEDEMTTIADTLVSIRSARPRTTSVMIRNVEEEPRRAKPVPTIQIQDKGKGKMVEPEPTLKNLRKEHILMDEELAQRLFEEEQAQFEKEMDADELLAERLQQEEREQFTVEENKPPTRAQLRNKMVTYLKHMGNYTHTQLKSKSFEEIQKLYEKEQKWINDFVPLDSEMVKDSGKEDGDSQKQAENIPRDDITMDFESLATKYPIINWKTHILTENILYYQIIRADGSSKNYKIFSRMLDDFDRQDMIDLYRLPSKEDEIWKNQQDYNLISWRLFDSCGVYVLLMDIGIAIHMMLENTYPLTQEMLSRMLNRRLEVDHKSEMAFELLRFTRSQL
ncbi:uncharacterized mitochondrial protein-like protein [Tanacetum coccineum]|uniref:Uncharacterized mitochondrial protein-like protein n=1 Tax=Tanacetum coccineum TaxID=301880 RepID=A0ABQ4XW74_9ASTR